MHHAGWLIALSMLSTAAHAASFDCRKAVTPTEKAICSTPSLSELDEHLGRYYAAARAYVGPAAAACLAKDQREWLSRRNACAGPDCLMVAYRSRLAELDPMQPGATAIKVIPLLTVNPIVWVQGPAEDTEAARRDSTPDPLRVVGRIVDDVVDGDGFVIQDAKGVKHVLLASMFITKSSGVVYETLAHTPDATFEASGQRERSSDGVDHFAPGHCVFVRRLPQK